MTRIILEVWRYPMFYLTKPVSFSSQPGETLDVKPLSSYFSLQFYILRNVEVLAEWCQTRFTHFKTQINLDEIFALLYNYISIGFLSMLKFYSNNNLWINDWHLQTDSKAKHKHTWNIVCSNSCDIIYYTYSMLTFPYIMEIVAASAILI